MKESGAADKTKVWTFIMELSKKHFVPDVFHVLRESHFKILRYSLVGGIIYDNIACAWYGQFVTVEVIISDE